MSQKELSHECVCTCSFDQDKHDELCTTLWGVSIVVMLGVSLKAAAQIFLDHGRVNKVMESGLF